MPKPATLDHLKSRKKPTTKVVEMVLDSELADAHFDAKQEVDLLELRLRSSPENEDIASDLRDAQRKLAKVRDRLEKEEAVVTFKFQSIPPHDYDAMVNEHPPTKEQRQDAKAMGDRAGFNPDTFPPALVAACLVEPKLSLDEVESLWKDENWNNAELQTLFLASVEVNSTRRTVDLGKG